MHEGEIYGFPLVALASLLSSLPKKDKIRSRMHPPWEFAADGPRLISPDGCSRLIYEDLDEIAMGGPLLGRLSLVLDGERFLISTRAGGPARWDHAGVRAVFPAWTENHRQYGTMQRLAVLDLRSRRVVYSEQRFGVLEIRGFDGDWVVGVDCPLQNSVEFEICLGKMRVLAEPRWGPLLRGCRRVVEVWDWQ